MYIAQDANKTITNLARIVRRKDKAIHRINHYPVDEWIIEWDRTSACEGAPGCRYQFIFDLTRPPNP